MSTSKTIQVLKLICSDKNFHRLLKIWSLICNRKTEPQEQTNTSPDSNKSDHSETMQEENKLIGFDLSENQTTNEGSNSHSNRQIMKLQTKS